MKEIVVALIIILATLLIILLSGWKILGWVAVIIIIGALVFISIGYFIIIPYMNWKDRKEMKALEKTIKEKENQGYTEEELEDLNRKLYLMKKTHE